MEAVALHAGASLCFGAGIALVLIGGFGLRRWTLAEERGTSEAANAIGGIQASSLAVGLGITLFVAGLFLTAAG